jgi:hypothetical protein
MSHTSNLVIEIPEQRAHLFKSSSERVGACAVELERLLQRLIIEVLVQTVALSLRKSLAKFHAQISKIISEITFDADFVVGQPATPAQAIRSCYAKKGADNIQAVTDIDGMKLPVTCKR